MKKVSVLKPFAVGVGVLLWLQLAFLACTSSAPVDFATEDVSAEEQRLSRAARIDSVSLRRLLDPDTVAGFDRLANLTAGAWILVEDHTGLLISQKQPHQRMYPASLTKMMTCLLALENGKMTDSIVVSDDVCVTRDCHVRSGDGYLEGHLIREMMMLSDNVAAYAVGKRVAGDTLAFRLMMNQKAAYLGMARTRFDNLNGMPNDSNYSTARDLLLLTRYAMADSTFAQIVGTPSLDIPLLDGRHLPCQNTNSLLTAYEGCIGVKTGYTRKAGSCLAAAATRNGATLYLILLNSANKTIRFEESALLLDYGFRVVEAYRQNKQKLLPALLRRRG